MHVKATVRVGAYIIRQNHQGLHQLLMFKHPDCPEAPIQSPGGGVEAQESLECALHREVFEECGGRSRFSGAHGKFCDRGSTAMRKIWRISLPFILCWGTWVLNSAPILAVDANLEATILDVIQHHPEAILRSLTTYQAQQQEQEHQAQLQTLKQLKQNIPAVIGSSPVLKHSQDSAVT